MNAAASDSPSTSPPRLRLPWPLPALLTWALAWAGHALLGQAGAPPAAAWLAGAAAGVALAAGVQGHWRRGLVAAGFPLSALALGASAPGWAWGLAAAVLLLAYPLRAWRDAPFFPTPLHALHELGAALPLPAGARVLDAGCGLGDGLRALRAAWPQARLEGVEWSAPLALLCARRCRGARVRRGDLWRDDWAPFEVVYLFQRPETMARAWAKASAEMRPGSWLVSLEFPVPEVAPQRRLDAGGGRPLWVYRIGAPPPSKNRVRGR